MDNHNRIRLKVFREKRVSWVAVGVAADSSDVTACLMHDPRESQLRKFSFDQWNAIPQHYFADQGLAPKTTTKHNVN